MPSTAEKLLARMRLSKADWGADDLHTLYMGFGFECEQGSKHTLYIHPVWHDLRATVGRHSPLAVGYVTTALRLVREVIQREEGQDER